MTLAEAHRILFWLKDGRLVDRGTLIAVIEWLLSEVEQPKVNPLLRLGSKR